MSAVLAPPRLTLDDLAREEGKAELVAGQVVPVMPTGHRPGQVAGRIFRRLADYADAAGGGRLRRQHRVRGGRIVDRPGVVLAGRGVLHGAAAGEPDAVRARAARLRGRGAQRERLRAGRGGDLAAKRAEYFEAGTLVVWDVDPVAARCAGTGGGGGSGSVRGRARGGRGAGGAGLAVIGRLAHGLAGPAGQAADAEPVAAADRGRHAGVSDFVAHRGGPNCRTRSFGGSVLSRRSDPTRMRCTSHLRPCSAAAKLRLASPARTARRALGERRAFGPHQPSPVTSRRRRTRWP